MTQEHLTDQQVDTYRRRGAEASEENAIASHMAACDLCLGRVIDGEHVGIAHSSLKESFLSSADEAPFHLSPEELERHATGQLDQADRTIFESHLEDCSECNGLAQDLVLVTPRSTAKESGERGSSTKPRGRFKGFWGRSPVLRPAYVGGLAVIILFATLLILYTRSRNSTVDNQGPPQTAGGTKNQQVESPTTNQAGDGPNSNENSTEQIPPNREGIIASLVDGTGEVTLDKQGRLSGLEGLSRSIETAVKDALSRREIGRPRALDDLESQGITLLGEPSASTPIALLAPLGVVSLDDRPAFSWKSLPNATDYTISIFDSNFNRVLRSPPQSANRWKAATPLKRGRTYFWEVTAIKDGREITSPVAPAPRAQFKIVDANTVIEIAQVRSTRPGSHLVLGVLYARAGLIADAEREFQLLVKANPGSEVARRLLSSVRSWKSR